jgi:hypothetical protein
MKNLKEITKNPPAFTEGAVLVIGRKTILFINSSK